MLAFAACLLPGGLGGGLGQQALGFDQARLLGGALPRLLKAEHRQQQRDCHEGEEDDFFHAMVRRRKFGASTGGLGADARHKDFIQGRAALGNDVAAEPARRLHQRAAGAVGKHRPLESRASHAQRAR